jgi:hypothetical protein
VSALLKLFGILSGKVKLEMDARGFMMVKTRSEVYLQGPVRGTAFNTDAGTAKKKTKAAKKMEEAA